MITQIASARVGSAAESVDALFLADWFAHRVIGEILRTLKKTTIFFV